jgi:hypothetical protein
MNARLFLIVFALIPAIPGSAWESEPMDEISLNLEIAKGTYRADVEKVHDAVLSHLGNLEATARLHGDRAAVEQIKNEKRIFKSVGTWPASVPDNIRQRMQTIEANMQSAYAVAVKEFTKAGKDELAKVIEDEAANFKKRSALTRGEIPRDYWTHSDGYFLKGMGDDWFEKWDNGRQRPFLFQEVLRTNEFVELRRIDDGTIVQLFNDHATIEEPKLRRGARLLYRGAWDDSSKSVK